jgi:acetyl esterase/lipase
VSRKILTLLGYTVIAAVWLAAQETRKAETSKPYIQKQDLIFAEIHGTGLLMDIFTPAGKGNGMGIVDVASGAWYSDRGKIRDHERAQMYDIYCGKGYTVFAVRPGSRTKYTGLEMLANVKTGIRYVKIHAAEFGISPDRLGLTGASAGGHLASLAALTPDVGDANAKDPLQKVGTAVKAVAVFFPPTNFLDWNGAIVPLDRFQEFFFGDKAAHTPEEIAVRARELSPALRVKAPAPPFLVIHGDADLTVPLQQSKILIDALKSAGGSGELIIKPGGGHAWPTIHEEVRTMSDWFDKKLAE